MLPGSGFPPPSPFSFFGTHLTGRGGSRVRDPEWTIRAQDVVRTRHFAGTREFILPVASASEARGAPRGRRSLGPVSPGEAPLGRCGREVFPALGSALEASPASLLRRMSWMRNEVNGLGGGPTTAPPPPSAGSGSRGGRALGERRCWALCISLGRPGAPRKVWHARPLRFPPHVERVAYVAGRRGGEPSSLGIGASGPEIRLVGFSTQQAGPPMTSAVHFGPARPSLPPSSSSCARCSARNGPRSSATTGSSICSQCTGDVQVRASLGTEREGHSDLSGAYSSLPQVWPPSSCLGLQDCDGLGRWEVRLHLSRGRSLREVALGSRVSPVDLGGYSPVQLG